MFDVFYNVVWMMGHWHYHVYAFMLMIVLFFLYSWIELSEHTIIKHVKECYKIYVSYKTDKDHISGKQNTFMQGLYSSSATLIDFSSPLASLLGSGILLMAIEMTPTTSRDQHLYQKLPEMSNGMIINVSVHKSWNKIVLPCHLLVPLPIQSWVTRVFRVIINTGFWWG